MGETVSCPALASVELQLWSLAVWTELIKVLASTNYVTRECKHFLLVNEGFSFGGLMASNCRGALSFPWEPEGCPWGSALSWLMGISQLLALMLLAAQWGDDSVCFVLVVKNGVAAGGAVLGAVIVHPHSCRAAGGLFQQCSYCPV